MGSALEVLVENYAFLHTDPMIASSTTTHCIKVATNSASEPKPEKIRVKNASNTESSFHLTKRVSMVNHISTNWRIIYKPETANYMRLGG